MSGQICMLVWQVAREGGFEALAKKFELVAKVGGKP